MKDVMKDPMKFVRMYVRVGFVLFVLTVYAHIVALRFA
jgi:hypothetical protein